MKRINTYITEKPIISKSTLFPETLEELAEMIKTEIKTAAKNKLIIKSSPFHHFAVRKNPLFKIIITVCINK